MRKFPKPIVFCSKCLGFDKCRWNSVTLPNKEVEKLKKHVKFITACPEVEIGLGVPRKPIRVVKEKGKRMLYQPAIEKDYSEKMMKFTDKFLNSLGEIDGFILKNRSPSCGLNDVKEYQGINKDIRPKKGHGFFGGEVLKRFNGLAIEDEGRLNSYCLRENFLIKLFTLTDFREMKKSKKVKDLVDFHTKNKLLFMAYSQQKNKELGRIVSNLKQKEVFERYEKKMKELLSKGPSERSWINVLMHAFGSVSKHLDKEEKKYFLDTLEEYRDERVSLLVMLKLIESYALRNKNKHLLEQTFLNLYPKDLIEIGTCLSK